MFMAAKSFLYCVFNWSRSLVWAALVVGLSIASKIPDPPPGGGAGAGVDDGVLAPAEQLVPSLTEFCSMTHTVDTVESSHDVALPTNLSNDEL